MKEISKEQQFLKDNKNTIDDIRAELTKTLRAHDVEEDDFDDTFLDFMAEDIIINLFWDVEGYTK